MSDPHRFGVVALAGPPNAGKSTLLNRIIGEKISIISRRPQTTRHRILGIKTLPGAQLVFVDTPGLHRSSRMLNRAMNRAALGGVEDADLVIFMIDVRGWTPEVEELFRRAAPKDTPVILAINKTDRLSDRERLLPLIKQSAAMHDFAAIIPISALKDKNMDAFLDAVIGAVPQGAPGFPADQRTDRSQRFFAAELVREQSLKQLGHELPHESAVEVTSFEYTDDKLLRVGVTIWVAKASQKSIVIGRGGQQLKVIGERARKQMERAFGARVYLDAWVKVKKGWADNAAMLQKLGYMED
ncbi:MAG: GTPase Era [Gammaproteobacteria bacterium]|nr:GTPase Era [Gammaproteobacteria bacterium]MDA7989622.1 GTPase Era [Gammaproteobacteria bacterium]MDA8010739.1 GTPase Era [Gammaproteobacteria bacterium]MDA8021527.1 GTPase Era [Gammaproteobacteria bacterium]